MAAFHFDAPRQTVTKVKASEALIAETKASEASSDQKAAEAGRGRGQLVWGLRRRGGHGSEAGSDLFPRKSEGGIPNYSFIQQRLRAFGEFNVESRVMKESI